MKMMSETGEGGYCLHAYQVSDSVVFSLQGECCSIGDFRILIDRDPAHPSAHIIARTITLRSTPM